MATINEHDRRQIGIDLASKDAAKVICDAIEDASEAIAAIDQFLYVPLPDLEAGEDLTDIPICQFDVAATLQSIKLIAQGDFAGVDASNTIVVSVRDVDGNVIVTKTYNNVTVPTNSGANALGTLDSTHKVLAVDEECFISITCGATADPPALAVQIRYRAN